MIYFSLGEYLDTTAKGTSSQSEIHVPMSGVDDKVLPHLAVMLSGVGEIGLKDVVTVVAMELLELEDILEV